MRVVWLSSRVLGADLCSTTQIHLANGLVEKGHSVDFYSPGKSTGNQFTHHHVPRSKRRGFQARSVAKNLTKRIGEFDSADVVLIDWSIFSIANKIKAPKVPKSFPVFISESELIMILNNTQMQLMKDIFTTAFYTGMRLGELVNMKWNWIDFTENIITIKNSSEFNSKNKRERIIPIHQKVQTILQTRFQLGKLTNALVFNRYKSIKLNEDFVSKQFKKAVRAAKLNDKIHFHTLRHSFASALVQRGISLYAVKELLGHGNIKTTQIYSHLQKDNLLDAVNLL